MTTGKREISKVSYENPVKNFEQCWASQKLIAKLGSQKNTIEEQSIQFRLKADDFNNQVARFQEFLQKIPILSVIKAWLEGKLTDPQWKERYFDNISQLFQNSLIPLIDSQGKLITLEYFIEHGHQAILENIRAIQT